MDYSADKLFDLLLIKKDINRLDDLIARTKASMSKESIAWVEQQFENINN